MASSGDLKLHVSVLFWLLSLLLFQNGVTNDHWGNSYRHRDSHVADEG